jgi:hypothetical protein
MMSRVKQFVVQVCVLAFVLLGFKVFASEFDPRSGELVAPELLVVREDPQGNRVILTLDEAPASLESEADLMRVAEAAEATNARVSPVEGGAEGSSPSEFDRTTGTAAWHYWYYPNNRYRYRGHYYSSYYYSYGYYSYYPVTYYNWGYYRYSYYYRW